MKAQLLLALIFISMTMPAFAGFEWRPPQEKKVPVIKRQVIVKPSPQPAEYLQPKADSGSQKQAKTQTKIQVQTVKEPVPLLAPLPPQAIKSPQPPQSPRPPRGLIVAPPPAAPQPKKTANQKPIAPTPSKGQGLVINPYPTKTGAAKPFAPIVSNGNSEYSPVNGFGKDIALALALRQIVPPQYSFSFTQNAGAKMGAKVSWDGAGRPWNVVACEIAASAGLSLNVVGKSIVIDVAG